VGSAYMPTATPQDHFDVWLPTCGATMLGFICSLSIIYCTRRSIWSQLRGIRSQAVYCWKRKAVEGTTRRKAQCVQLALSKSAKTLSESNCF
jgi:hypothetical protein